MRWAVVYAKHALKDAKKLSAAGLKEKAQALLEVLAGDGLSVGVEHIDDLKADMARALQRL